MAFVSKLMSLLQSENFKDVIGNNGSIAFPSSNIYKQLSAALDNSLRPKYIYTILKLNRYNIYKDLLLSRNIKVEENVSNVTETSIDTLNNSRTISFSLNVTDIWSQISDKKVKYNFKNRGERNIRILWRHAWTNILYDRLYSETKLPCALTFKCAKLSESGIFLTVTGKCPECKCNFIGQIVNAPEKNDDNIKMECTIHDYDSNVKHNKKRQLKGLERKQIAHKLVEGKTLPCIWRREQANILMDVGDDEPAHLYSCDVLRKAKQERQDMLLGVTSTNIFESLWLMKYNSRYEGAIRFIGLDPLIVHYWTREQFALYEKYHTILYIDATGSLIKKIKLPNGELCSHIYLYQAVVQVAENTAPIFQMISTSQNTNTIVFWLQEFLRTGAMQNSSFPSPKEIVTDFDKALLGAVARAFAKSVTLHDYLATCFALLTGAKISKPSCLLRLDICHFMNMIARWNCFSGKPHIVRSFFMRSMAILRRQKTFHEFEEVTRNILILAMSPYQNSNSVTMRARNSLTSLIQGDTDTLTMSINDQSQSTSTEHENYQDMLNDVNVIETNIDRWVNLIYNDCVSRTNNLEETYDINGFYCVDFAKKFKALLKYFPLFTEIMPAVFGYGSTNATSAAVESEFNDLKNRTLRDISLPMRADKFVSKHIFSLSGKIKLAMAGKLENDFINADDKNEIYSNNNLLTSTDIPNTNNSDINLIHDDSIELTELQAEQNWRNKNIKKQAVCRYADACPNFDSSSDKYVTLPTIPNGNYCKNVKNGKMTLIVTNTCGFDSLCQILSVSLANNEAYNNALLETSSKLIICAKVLIKEGLSAHFFRERAKILCNLDQLKPDIRPSSIIKVSAISNIANLTTWLLDDVPSFTEINTCDTCNRVIIRKNVLYTNINYTTISEKGMQFLQEALNEEINVHRICCGNSQKSNIIYGPHLIIETECGDQRLVMLSEYPVELHVTKDNKYTLSGIIAYKGNNDVAFVGHYIAYVKTGRKWIYYDDNSRKGKSGIIDERTLVKGHICIYILSQNND